ncbi:unnamed protein product, partial [Symbiodinium microadriaticum]
VPYSYCLGKRYAKKKSTYIPACVDNNSSLNTLQGCYDIYGNYSSYCAQVGYTQNAFIALCGSEFEDDDHCGTFLEIHQGGGTPYSSETDIIGDVKITTRDVSGYYTTTLPMTWMGDPNRVLCAYTESYVRVGSTVYINHEAPVCCCPPAYASQSRTGSFLCPLGTGGSGPYAAYLNKTKDLLQNDIDSTSYPFCRSGVDDVDRVMCSTYDSKSKMYFTRECSPVYNRTETLFTSDDLHGDDYVGVCPYFDNCALSQSGTCSSDDLRFTFMGRVGRVVGYDPSPITPVVTVTFNNGRTSYDIEEDDLNLEYTKSMYEIWWVKRTRSEFIVEKRK